MVCLPPLGVSGTILGVKMTELEISQLAIQRKRFLTG